MSAQVVHFPPRPAARPWCAFCKRTTGHLIGHLDDICKPAHAAAAAALIRQHRAEYDALLASLAEPSGSVTPLRGDAG